MLKFDLYSDIHLDHWDSYGFEIEEYIPTPKSDNLIIAGDIATTLSNKNEKVSKLNCMHQFYQTSMIKFLLCLEIMIIGAESYLLKHHLLRKDIQM